MQVLHGGGDIFGVADAELPGQGVGDVVDDVLESAAADELQDEVEVLLFGEHDAHELDDVRVAEVAEHLGLLEKGFVAGVQLGVVDEKVHLGVGALGLVGV